MMVVEKPVCDIAHEGLQPDAASQMECDWGNVPYECRGYLCWTKQCDINRENKHAGNAREEMDIAATCYAYSTLHAIS